MIPFSSFFDLVDFSDIDFIELNVGSINGFDLILDGIFVVPEPNTAVLLIVASVAMITRRWR